MLFDLRGRGRQRTVKAIYLALAVLMGGGLVFFGIGGNTSGGLFDAFSGSAGSDGSERLERQVSEAERTLRTNPRDAAAHIQLVRAHAQLATFGEERYNSATGEYTEEGRAQLQKAVTAWNTFQGTDPKPDDETARAASIMVGAFAALNDFEGATQAQEIVAQSRQSTGAYSTLAQLAYQAGLVPLGDRAADRAVKLEDPDLRENLRAQLRQLKSGATGAAAATPTPEAG